MTPATSFVTSGSGPTTVRLGISTCPNDTFAFAGLLEGRVDTGGLRFEIELLDIQQLNDRLFAGDFAAAKTSFHAALLLGEQTVVLPSGSALGFGVGPLLLASRPKTRPESMDQRTLLPGRHTTAALLYQLFYGGCTRSDHVVFSEIMPQLKTGQADFGVCIHEGRFTWQQEGLSLVEDLGTRWEQTTGSPLPLGGLVARRSLPSATIHSIQDVVRRSLEMALEDPDSALPQMRRYAQEFDDRVLMQHVELYVNDWTVDLGEEGRRALAALSQQAKRCGVIPADGQDLVVF